MTARCDKTRMRVQESQSWMPVHSGTCVSAANRCCCCAVQTIKRYRSCSRATMTSDAVRDCMLSACNEHQGSASMHTAHASKGRKAKQQLKGHLLHNPGKAHQLKAGIKQAMQAATKRTSTQAQKAGATTLRWHDKVRKAQGLFLNSPGAQALQVAG